MATRRRASAWPSRAAVTSTITAAFLLTSCSGSADPCLQETLLFGVAPWKGQYEDICCKVPQHAAEHRTFQEEPDIRFFSRLRETKLLVERNGSSLAADLLAAVGASEALPWFPNAHVSASTASGGLQWTFYDSQCGMPLFVAPRGRSFEDWEKESLDHGWPSFRDEEVVAGSISVIDGGEVVSNCPRPTHLGHRFGDSQGSRYCIDLICMAGQAGNNTMSAQLESLASQSPSSSRSQQVTPFLLLLSAAAMAAIVR